MNMNNKYGAVESFDHRLAIRFSASVNSSRDKITKGNFHIHKKIALAVADPRQSRIKASKLLFLINFFCLDKETNLDNVLL